MDLPRSRGPHAAARGPRQGIGFMQLTIQALP